MTEVAAPIAAPVAAPAPAPAPAPVAEPVVVPVVAPVAAPVAAVPAIGVAETPADDGLAAEQTGQTFQYEATGNTMLDYALTFVGSHGFGPDHPAVKAAGQGNWAILEVELARLGDKAVGSDKIIQLAKTAVADAQAAADTLAKETRALCVQTFGGTEAQFDAMMTWITTQANEGKIKPEERADLNRMLARGGFQATLAVQSIAAVYANASGNRIEPAETSAETGAPLSGDKAKTWDTKSWSAYNRQMRATHGPNFEAHPEFQRARASAAVQAGLIR